MTDITKDTNQDERQLLIQRAQMLGIEHSNNIGTESLRSRIKARLEEEEDINELNAIRNDKDKEILNQRNEAMKLVRVIVTSLDNMKNEYDGDIFKVSNNVVGTVTRMIPFNREWHIESIFLDTLRDIKMQKFYEEKLPDGNKIRRGKLVPAYGIQVLEALTAEEFATLKASQLARQSIES